MYIYIYMYIHTHDITICKLRAEEQTSLWVQPGVGDAMDVAGLRQVGNSDS